MNMDKLFDSFTRNENRKTTLPVELVEPSTGRVIELKVTEEREFTANLYMDQLMTYAEDMAQYGAQCTTSCRTVRIEFPDENMAENARQLWRKRN